MYFCRLDAIVSLLLLIFIQVPLARRIDQEEIERWLIENSDESNATKNPDSLENVLSDKESRVLE